MKATTRIPIIVLSIAIVFSCAKAKNESAMERDEAPSPEMAAGAPVMADSVSDNGFVPSSAARTDKDKGRKFIRTATMKFRVNNVIKSTYKIEEITAGFDGFVTYTNLASEMDNQTIVPISADSSLETIFFTVSNTFTLRVPNTNLDSTLRTFARLIDYLDYRTIEASDV